MAGMIPAALGDFDVFAVRTRNLDAPTCTRGLPPPAKGSRASPAHTDQRRNSP